MVQRVLPIYLSGWFYLLLTFWTFSLIFSTDGGLKNLSQYNLNWLSAQFNSHDEHNKSLPKSPSTLTLTSQFNENDVDLLKVLLTTHADSKVVLLGELPAQYLTNLASYLDEKPRKHKIIVASNDLYSGETINTMTGILPQLIAPFRYPSKDNIKRVNSRHYLFTPYLSINNHVTPLLWQQHEHIYLSLTGELIQQLNSAKLLLEQSWQLSLFSNITPLTGHDQKSSTTKMGFSSSVFTAEVSTLNTDKKLSKAMPINTISQYNILSNQQQNTFSRKYDVIIIRHESNNNYQNFPAVLNQILTKKSLVQDFTTGFAVVFSLLVGLVLIWFIIGLPIKRQAIILFVYFLILVAIQYYLFRHQQWLNVPPLLLLLSGTWAIYLGYQQEKCFFDMLLNKQFSDGQASQDSQCLLDDTEQHHNNINSNNIGNNVELSPLQSHQHIDNNSEGNTSENLRSAEEDLDKTMVIQGNASGLQSKSQQSYACQNFGRYQVEGILGKGAMGIVYQGVDPKINRHVAIKTLSLSDEDDTTDNQAAKARFFREAQTAGGLSHANIVTIYDVGEENNLGYIAMDLLTGAPLSLFTQANKTLPAALIYQLLIQICDALDYAHKRDVVHRDIKPANIIYDDDLLKVTVTDFGIAYVSNHSKTRTGIIMGSPYYMSPEQILGLKIDGRSDIFSLGVTFYQLLSGHLPFEGESIATVAYQITKAKATPVNQLNSTLPSSAQRICNKAMHKDISKRYQSMAEFKLALLNALKRDFKVSMNT